MTPEELNAFRARVRSLTYNRGIVLAQFTPTEDFYSEEFQSQYCKGLTYYVTEARDAEGNVVVSPLAQKVEEWRAAGRVA